MKAIRFITVPEGEAPEYVRRAWLGLVLPLSQPEKVRTLKGAGYVVNGQTAFSILADASPEAAQWWKESKDWRPLIEGGLFVWPKDCEVVDMEETGWPPPPIQQLVTTGTESGVHSYGIRPWHIGVMAAVVTVAGGICVLWYMGVFGP